MSTSTSRKTKVRFASERMLWLVAVGLLVFFARWRVPGLQPDAALYAGLARKILATGEYWLLSGTDGRFPQYFEHPPYFFQWGAQVLRVLGSFGLAESDGAARAIGGFPGLLGFLALTLWTWARLDWEVAALCTVMLASFGHYTKYASTAMLEGPLSLGVILTAIAAFELHWQARQRLKRPAYWLLLAAGLLLATASKGVAGLGAWGGLGLSAGIALFLSERHAFKNFVGLFFLLPCLLLSLAPMGFWLWQLWRHEGGEVWLHGYLQNQIWRSFFSDRGEATAAPAASSLYFLKVLAKVSWPWGWTVVAAWISILLGRKRFQNEIFRTWGFHALAFFLAFFLPFSLSRYKLPHYLHPTYLVLAPLGAFWLARMLPERWLKGWAQNARLRWGVWLVALTTLVTLSTETTRVNRGQAFRRVQAQVLAAPQQCSLRVPSTQMDAYQMEAYGLWYFHGRAWEISESEIPSRIAVPKDTIYWNPKTDTLWGRGPCEIAAPAASAKDKK